MDFLGFISYNLQNVCVVPKLILKNFLSIKHCHISFLQNRSHEVLCNKIEKGLPLPVLKIFKILEPAEKI
jgi:hypothetical protein